MISIKETTSFLALFIMFLFIIPVFGVVFVVLLPFIPVIFTVFIVSYMVGIFVRSVRRLLRRRVGSRRILLLKNQEEDDDDDDNLLAKNTQKTPLSSSKDIGLVHCEVDVSPEVPSAACSILVSQMDTSSRTSSVGHGKQEAVHGSSSSQGSTESKDHDSSSICPHHVVIRLDSQETSAIAATPDSSEPHSSSTPHNSNSSEESFRPPTIRDFRFIEFLGEGAHGTVAEYEDVRIGKRVAIKTIKRSDLVSSSDVDKVKEEFQLQASLDHPNIIRAYFLLDDDEAFYMVMELADCDLKSVIEASDGLLPEYDAARYLVGLVHAVLHCHSRDVLHRDIKMGNILIDEEDNVKLCDFGWSVRVMDNEWCHSMCGTIDYNAPEILDEQPYDHTVDTWAIGILLFAMLYGKLPFKERSERKTLERIKAVDLKFPKRVKVSTEGKDLVRGLLQKDPKQRLRLEEVLQHPWIRRHVEMA